MPDVQRPAMSDYGVSIDPAGALPFEWARERLAANRNYWAQLTLPGVRSACAGCQDGAVTVVPRTDLQPEDERTALVQCLDRYRAIADAALLDVSWEEATARLLPATDLTIAGVVKHLAWAEDRWFQGRLLGARMPTPWDAPGADDPDRSMRLVPGDTIDGIVELYSLACERSRAAVARCDSLSRPALVPSFGIGPVNLRWILVHMIDETARHAGHLDLLRDAIRRD